LIGGHQGSSVAGELLVADAAANPGAHFHEHAMLALGECARPGRGERDALLGRLDLLGHADDHGNPSPSSVVRAASRGAMRHCASPTTAPWTLAGMPPTARGARPRSAHDHLW